MSREELPVLHCRCPCYSDTYQAFLATSPMNTVCGTVAVPLVTGVAPGTQSRRPACFFHRITNAYVY
jgi:uncharacterized protein (DUF983 family)